VINNTSSKTALAQELLAYMTTEEGQKAYIEQFPYYIPTRLSLKNDILEQKINPDYNIVYKDFYKPDAILSPFNMGDEGVFENDISNILDA